MIDKNSTQHKKQQLDKILQPFQEFVNAEVSSGIVLMLAVIIAMIIANSPLKDQYFDTWLIPFSISFGSYFELTKPVILWINDGLMALFFLLVGLEIKREVLVGELASFNKALLPAVSAIGGMSIPALIYILFNLNTPWANAWAVPVATDIAFTLGILALLGKRVPVSLKLFLASFAIVDDIGGVLIIAIFYTDKLAFEYLILSAILFIALLGFNFLGGKKNLVYFAIGVLIWIFILKSGIHATIAGILLAITIPATKKININEFTHQAKYYIDTLNFQDENSNYESEIHHSAVKQLQELCIQTETPLQKLEHSLAPWVAFIVIPIFAFANAGVDLSLILNAISINELISHPVFLGIFFGLIIGNPIGINLLIYTAKRLNLIQFPPQVTWIHVIGVSCLAGVGFTMSHFIASLAFASGSDVLVLNIARFVILVGSAISGAIGFTILFFSEKLNKLLIN
jgi:NhaA family Na+:H+ antiporter